MFRDDAENQKKVVETLDLARQRVGMINSLPLIALAGEACNHVDDQDECSVSVRCSKEHGIQFFYSGCEVHATMLASLLSVHMQKVIDEKQFVSLDGQMKFEAKMILIRIAQVIDGEVGIACEVRPPENKKKKE
jgi:hypothetical protein